MVSVAVKERIARAKTGLPTHDLIVGWYWVKMYPAGTEVAYWDGNIWHGCGWSGGGFHVNVLSHRLEPPDKQRHIS